MEYKYTIRNKQGEVQEWQNGPNLVSQPPLQVMRALAAGSCTVACETSCGPVRPAVSTEETEQRGKAEPGASISLATILLKLPCLQLSVTTLHLALPPSRRLPPLRCRIHGKVGWGV